MTGRSIHPSPDVAVLITGCDSGLGLAAAEKLNQQGFFVFACCLSLESEGANRLSGRENIHVLQCNVTSDDDIARVTVEVTSILGYSTKSLHGVINNAGVSISGLIECSKNINDLIRTLNVNLFGTIRITKAFLPLIRNSKGRIINMSSVAARDAALGFTDYCLSKAAISKFSECLDLEVSSFGVRVITIEPFFFKTNTTDPVIHETQLRKQWDECDEQVKESYPEIFERMITQLKMTHRFHIDSPDKVTRVILEALTSSDPNSFYRPGYPVLVETLFLYLPYDVLLPMRRVIPAVFGLVYRYWNSCSNKTDNSVEDENLVSQT
jgi:NAD(P)-dependent dehydrogenase (short-subunit alcohol dehydrogenase family)